MRVMSERPPVNSDRASFDGLAMGRHKSERPATPAKDTRRALLRTLSGKFEGDIQPDAACRAVRRAAYAAAAQHRQRHRNTLSLGSHVNWQDLLEFAGDEDSWRAKKVHRWLGVSEEIGVSLLAELLELKKQLAEEETGGAASSSSSATAAQQATRETGFFSWMFGGSSRAAPAAADTPADETAAAAPAEEAAASDSGVLSWLFGGLSGEPGRARADCKPPPKIVHRNPINYQYEELQELGCLGNGAFGAVTLVRCHATQQTFALKAVSKGLIIEQQLQANIRNERDIMQSVYCPFLVKLAATFNRGQFLYLLIEPCMGGDLYTVYRQEDLFGSQEHARYFAACVSLGFEHMQSRNIIYRDLKMENLVLDAKGCCKLCDFGTSVFAFPWAFTLCGTPEYMAPEVVTGRGYNNTVDWWALGILVYEMLMGETPFVADEPLQILRKIRQGIDTVDFPEGHCWCDFVRGLCADKPDRRLPALPGGTRNITEQDWFEEADFNWEALRKCQMQPPHVPQVEGPEDLSNFAADEQELPERLEYEESQWEEIFRDFEDPRGPASIHDEPLSPRTPGQAQEEAPAPGRPKADGTAAGPAPAPPPLADPFAPASGSR